MLLEEDNCRTVPDSEVFFEMEWCVAKVLVLSLCESNFYCNIF